MTGASNWIVECSTSNSSARQLLDLVEHPGQVPVVEARVVDDHVHGEDRQAGGHLGRVQVVHLVDVVDAEQPGPDRVEVETGRGRLEQDVRGVAEQPDRARDDQHAR